MGLLFEYATGSDSFRRAQSKPPRSVTLTAFVFNPKSGFFENPRSLTLGGDVCKVDKVHKAMPASTVLAISPGNWWYYRSEVRAGALWCFEYRHRTGGSFEFDTQFLLVRIYKEAPLCRVRLNLPEHPFANVHELDFVWNAQFIKSHDKLTAHELAAFKKIVGETSDYVVEATQDEGELNSWEFTTIEKAKPQTKKLVRVKNKVVAINRVKRLRL